MINISTSPVSNKCLDGGLILTNTGSPDNSLDIFDFDEVIEYFEKYGLIVFRNFDLTPDKVKSFTDQFTSQYAHDAPRREAKFNTKVIKGVDTGCEEIKLHSEASFAPIWPEILWFFCKTPPPKNSGQTSILDGSRLWQALPSKSKSFFMSSPVQYELKVPISAQIKNKGKQAWPAKHIGTKDVFVDWDKGEMHFKQLRYAVHSNRDGKSYSFCNHLIVDFKSEPQLISRKFLFSDNKNDEKEILDEVNRLSEEFTYLHSWNKNDFIMLDNKRFMHGRVSFDSQIERDISQIQTNVANFSYGQSSRKKGK
jgi:alpha-ketoglutarate-dependent taurine dioxygenase